MTVSLVFSTYLLVVKGEEAGIYAGALFVMPFLFVPGLWQLYQYVWKRKALWQKGIDQSKLVPLLVKTVQELEARIKALEDA